ncbi:hypothetical protein EPN15_00415 [Patescibacteria group bacterium]|nr:MAG: hypothetical protein EPN15_00415 [Patescibacteria group bacterium]
MTIEKFESVCEQLGKRFKLADEGEEALENPAGIAVWKVYELPGKLIRLTLKTKAKFEKENVLTAKRIGAQAHIERVYSDTEKVNTLMAEQKKEGSDEWEEVRIEDFQF